MSMHFYCIEYEKTGFSCDSQCAACNKTVNMPEIKNEQDRLLEISAELWNEYLKTKPAYPDEQTDFRFHIHAIQNIIISKQYKNEQTKN